MKKTQVFSTDVRYANTEIKKLEADGWEILRIFASFKWWWNSYYSKTERR